MARDPLKGRELVLGVTGSIAAYKAADLCSTLAKRGLGVTVLMSRAAAAFVGPLTFSALTGKRVIIDLLDASESDIEHLAVTGKADAMLIAPATANALAKLASGIADDAVTTAALALPRGTPLLVAPAMNARMWEHPAVQENLARLKARGAEVVPPAEGVLACGTVGVGKLASVADLVSALERAFSAKPSARQGVLHRAPPSKGARP